ncbi:hypothetical protein [Catellatospora sp. NPDC049609]|uniref:hypothetical protein n=1 Tax=Catellatospora sp. NPDC049609 TaxID=3155505 RepID=UPI003416103C
MLDIDDCLQQLMELQGVHGASLIDFPSGSVIGAAGRGPGSIGDAPADAAGMIHATMQTAAFATVGQPAHVEDIVITAGNGYHVMRLLRSDIEARMVLYLWLDRAVGNLVVAQRQLSAIAAQFSAN